MVRLDKIVTKAGDGGKTRLATGEPISKANPRVEAYGAVDEANSAIGVARLHTTSDPVLDPILDRIQNDLFDLGADLATPGEITGALRVTQAQVDRLEREIDAMNADLEPLTSFILPGGSALAAHLHVARTVVRRAERIAVEANETDAIGDLPIRYLNRLSDHLFVMARHCNDKGRADVLWVPGANR